MSTPSVELAAAYISLVPSAKGIGAAVSSEMGAPLAAAGVAGGKNLGDNVNKGFNARALGAAAGKALAVGVGAGIAGGAALFKIGETFDEAFDQIRIGTGATGDALEGLKNDFKEVFANVPADAGTVSTAIADLNTRMGLTGEPLQALATQFIDLSRITGTDLSSNIEGLTQTFKNWDIDQPAEALDKLFRASQTGGIGIDQLQQQVTQFGAPLRQMGFGFDESIALLAGFERSGIQTSRVMRGLGRAAGEFAKDGVDAGEGIRAVFTELQRLGPGADATALAVETFGATAGVELADAIADGQFSVSDLYAAISTGEETIASAAADTDSFAESWRKLVNKVLVALEPLATKVFTAVGDAVDAIAPKIERAISAVTALFSGDLASAGVDIGLMFGFQEDSGFTDAVIRGFEGVKSAVTGIISAFRSAVPIVRQMLPAIAALAAGFVAFRAVSRVIGIIRGIQTAFMALNAAMVANPVGLVIAGVVALGVALFAAYQRFEGFRNVVDTVGRFLRDVFMAALEGIRNWWDTNGDTIISVAQAVWSGIQTGAEAAWNVISTVFSALAGFVTSVLVPVLGRIFDVVRTVFDGVATVISWVWSSVIQPAFQLYAKYVTGVLIPAVQIIWTVASTVFRAVAQVVSWAWSSVVQPVLRTLASFVTGTLVPILSRIWDTAKAVFEGVAAAVSWAWSNVVEPVFNALRKFIVNTLVPRFLEFRDRVEAVWQAVSGAVGTAWSFLSDRFEDIKRGIRVVADWVGDRIDDVIGFFSGIKDRIGDALSTIADVVKKPFVAAFNFIVDAWNNTLGGFEFTVPDIPGLPGRGSTIGFPTLPRFHTGGIVPGPRGAEVPILALARERILTPDQYDNLAMAPAPAGVAGDGVTAHYYEVEKAPTPDDLARKQRRSAFGVMPQMEPPPAPRFGRAA